MKQDFHGNFQVKFTWFFPVFLWCPWLNCAHSGMFWKISSLCTSQRTKLSLTIKTDDVTSGRKDVDLHGRSRRLRGEWVKVRAETRALLMSTPFFFKQRSQKQVRFISSFSPKMCSDLTVKWNDLTWNEVTVKPNIRVLLQCCFCMFKLVLADQGGTAEKLLAKTGCFLLQRYPHKSFVLLLLNWHWTINLCLPLSRLLARMLSRCHQGISLQACVSESLYPREAARMRCP